MSLLQILTRGKKKVHTGLLFIYEHFKVFFYILQTIDLDSIKCFLYIFRTLKRRCK